MQLHKGRSPPPLMQSGHNCRARIYGFDGQIRLFYSSTVYAGPSGSQFPQKGYETLALRAEWTDPSDRFTIGLWGDNVTNSRYRTQVQYANNGIGANGSKPTTFGVDLGAKF